VCESRIMTFCEAVMREDMERGEGGMEEGEGGSEEGEGGREGGREIERGREAKRDFLRFSTGQSSQQSKHQTCTLHRHGPGTPEPLTRCE